MAAALTVTPSSCRVGQAVVVAGSGFAASTKVQVDASIAHEGIETSHDIDADANGAFSSTDLADPAFTILTSDATNVSVDDTVTIGAVTYTFKAAPTTVANQVKIGADAAATLANLKKAVNLTGVSGTDYGSGTVIHPTVSATTLTATTLKLVAKTNGTGGNSLVSTEASTHLSFTSTVFAGGAAGSGESTFRFTPQRPGIVTFTASDGTSTATARLTVYAGGA